MNAVRNEQERVGFIFNNIEADYFNFFIDATGLVDLPIGGRCFTWMNKVGTKLSKLNRFLISEDVIDFLLDIRINDLDRIWLDHNPILLYVDKINFGPSLFKLYNSWLLRDGFDDLIKSKWDSLDSNKSGFPIKCHEKFHILKAKIRQWNNNNKTMKRNRKAVAFEELSSIENKINEGSTSPSDTENRLNLLHELEIIDKFALMDLIQKARVKWDIEGDENTKFFHGLINQKIQNQMINVKFQAQDSQILFPNLPHSQTLNSMDRDYLERLVIHEEIKEAVWDYGSSKALGPDGFSFAFVKKYWDIIKKDLHNFINSFFASCDMPYGANSSFFTLIPKVNNPTLITDFRPISLIGIHYKIIAKILANQLSKVIDKIVSKEQSAFIAGHQILDGPIILNHILDSLGFGLKWCSWIKTCLSSSRASILVNDSPTSEFSINRGLRQGDPLSPFLFILVMEGLHNAFVDAMDDVIITTGWNARDLENIIRVLHVFYLASGLKINIYKSNIYGIGLTRMRWKILIHHFRSRLSTWKASLLSIGGRLTLIKSVLGSLGIYYLSIFRAPESILNDLERIRSNFFLGGNQDGKKMAWVKWPIILNSYDNGCLNISSLKAFNLAILQKWRWRLFTSPNDLWVKVVKAFHGHEGGFNNNGCSFKGAWANFVGSSNFLHSKDIWVGEAPLSVRYNRLYSLDQDKDCLIIDRIINGQWHWNWSRTNIGVRNLAFFRDMLNEIGQLNIVTSEDTSVWNLGPNGTFTVKDARNIIDQKTLPSLPSTSWDKIISRKVNIFMWRLSLDRLLHRLNLSLRGMDILAISYSSCNANVESANHIFFECIIAYDLLKLVYKWCEIPFVKALSFEAFKDWLSSWHAPK
ncbi:putative RNA-directed DNA polymerase, eukaryota, reverse transcriptase zinc-binding domain protein [Tanacetum coccineum]|uniref:RNA-directed DNA polymerase, eukaryota, reverse transcriptase zinc-binding domain protein n=1 Tax=Tanacetum coccineum TaxID=301880 RepID=A0ABQ5D582_9ASTR